MIPGRVKRDFQMFNCFGIMGNISKHDRKGLL
jgi:hypothetical protein